MPTHERPTDGANLSSLAPSTEKPTWPAAMGDLPDELLKMLVKLVVKGEPGSVGLISLSDASKGMRAAMHRVAPDVLRVSLPQTVSTETLVQWMWRDRVIASEVLAVPRQREASVAILSRLVDLSKLARSEKVSEKERAIARKLIDTARPDLLASLRNATVGEQGTLMYREPDALADEVIERLKGPTKKEGSARNAGEADRMSQGAYDPIPSLGGELKRAVDGFIRNEIERADLIKKHGPLCLWDVSAVKTFYFTCSVLFSSDLFWDTSSVTIMGGTFRANAQFKGYIGTWDVSNAGNMMGMFYEAGIEDSGIGSWNTKSLTSAWKMFKGAKGLSKDLDLSRWTFGPKPNLSSMFEGSGIVDCGIGNWDVSQANTRDMLKDANKFTGFMSLKPPKWPTEPSNDKVLQANVPKAQQRPFGAAAFGAHTSASRAQMTLQARIAGILADLARDGRVSSRSKQK